MSARAATAPVIDDVDLASLEQDPHPHFARWRRETPVAYLPLLGGYTIARWDDCDHIGKLDGKTTKENANNRTFFGDNVISLLEGDVHRAMRVALDGSFSPRAVRRTIEAAARPVTRRILAELRDEGAADAGPGLLERISTRVVADVLGLQDADELTLQHWFHTLVSGLANYSGDAETIQRSNAARAEAEAYLRQKVDEYTAHPGENTISHMIHDTPDGIPRTWEDIRATVVVLIMGGFQEPGHAASASLLGLLRNPDQLAAVRDDPSLVPAAVHEGLRWIAPFQSTERFLLEDVEVGGVHLPAGAEIHLLLGSANRDETRWEHPDDFDVLRERQPVASFGFGNHFCAGHFLGRELERVALEEVLQLPGLRLDPDHGPEVTGFTMRGVRCLPVRWDT